MVERHVREQVEIAEQQRCRALIKGDLAALERLMGQGLVHVHGDGVVEDRETYLSGILRRYRFECIERGPLKMVLHGESILAVGSLQQQFAVRGEDRIRTVEGVATQLWTSHPEGWRQVLCHNAFHSGS